MAGLLPALLVGQVAGILWADAGGASRALTLGLGALLAVLGLLVRRRRRLRAACSCGVALLAGAAGLAARREEARPLLRTRQVATLEGRVARRRDTSLDLEWVRAVDGGTPLPGRIRLYANPGDPLLNEPPGRWLRVRARLAPPPGIRNPGGRDRARRLARQGVGAEGRLVHPRLWVPLGMARSGWRRGRARAAARLREQGRGGALLAALGLGDSSGLPAPTRRGFARLGLAHLLAISGLHLTLVGGLAFSLTRPLLGRLLVRTLPAVDARRVALGPALLAAASYGTLSGAGFPARRAFGFACVLALVVWRRRPSLRLQPLVLAALVMLAGEPALLFSPAAQLSFAASAGLLWSRGRGTDPGPEAGLPVRLLHRLEGGLRVSASAAAATAPWLALHFGAAPGLAWITNVVAVPAVAVGLLPLALCSSAVAWLDPPGADALLRAAATAADLLPAAVQRVAAALPPAEGIRPGTLGLLASGLVGVAAVRTRSTLLRVLLAMLASGMPGWLSAISRGTSPPRVVFFDVGQGDSALVQVPGATVLVDGGTALPGGLDRGSRTVVPALRALGVRRLDLVVASHSDLDHRGGLAAVLESLPVARLWLPQGSQGDTAFLELRGMARRRGVLLAERGLGDPILRLGELAVEPLWPPRQRSSLTTNDASLVIRLAWRGRRLLFPGDLEQVGEGALLASGADLRSDVLKVPHHGSRTSTSPQLLESVAPRVAVVSAPRAGRFGMPHATVLARLRAMGCEVAWTGRDGAVVVALEGPLRARSWIRDSVEAHHAAGQGQHRGGEHRADQPFPSSYRQVRAQSSTRGEARSQAGCCEPGDLACRQEDRDGQQGEAEVEHHLDAVGLHQVEAAEGQCEQEKQPHPGLEGAPVQSDPEEHGGPQPGRVLPSREPRPGAAQGGEQQGQHDQTEQALEGGVGEAGCGQGPQQGTRRHGQQHAAGVRDAGDALGPEPPDRHPVLDQYPHAIGPVGEGSRQAQEHQQRNREERAAAGQGVHDAGDQSPAGEQECIADVHRGGTVGAAGAPVECRPSFPSAAGPLRCPQRQSPLRTVA